MADATPKEARTPITPMAYITGNETSGGESVMTQPWGCETLERIIDVFIVTARFLLALLPWAVVAILIKLDSLGPVRFYQKRFGHSQTPFNIIKFRTMTAGTEFRLEEVVVELNGDDSLMRIPKDLRTTRMGSFLRKLSIDETSRFINVLKGQMSLVSPRPTSRAIMTRATHCA